MNLLLESAVLTNQGADDFHYSDTFYVRGAAIRYVRFTRKVAELVENRAAASESKAEFTQPTTFRRGRARRARPLESLES